MSLRCIALIASTFTCFNIIHFQGWTGAHAPTITPQWGDPRLYRIELCVPIHWLYPCRGIQHTCFSRRLLFLTPSHVHPLHGYHVLCAKCRCILVSLSAPLLTSIRCMAVMSSVPVGGAAPALGAVRPSLARVSGSKPDTSSPGTKDRDEHMSLQLEAGGNT